MQVDKDWLFLVELLIIIFVYRYNNDIIIDDCIKTINE